MVLKDLFTYVMTCVQCRGMQLNSVILGRRDSPKHKTFSLRLYRYIKFRQVSALILTKYLKTTKGRFLCHLLGFIKIIEFLTAMN